MATKLLGCPEFGLGLSRPSLPITQLIVAVRGPPDPGQKNELRIVNFVLQLSGEIVFVTEWQHY